MKKIFITILLAALMPFAAGAQDARQRTAETIVADALAQLPAQTPKAFDSLIFITILLAALMPFAAGAQDARQRTAETIVADALAQLPAQTPKAFDSLMQELAATGADGIRMMAAMLVPAAEGKNAPVEYAINGVVSYVTAAGREELAREIRAGLTDAVAASTDKPNQAFLLSQLQLCATAAEAPVFVKYAADEYRNGGRSPRIREIRRGRIPRRLRRARTDLHARNRRGDPRTDRRKPGPGRPAGLCRRGEAPCGRRARAAEMGRRPQGRHADERGCL